MHISNINVQKNIPRDARSGSRKTGRQKRMETKQAILRRHEINKEWEEDAVDEEND